QLLTPFLFCFFQAEDGIRDLIVTGVQTCALPIWIIPGCTCNGRRTKRPRPSLPSAAMRDSQRTASSPKPKSSRPRRDLHHCHPRSEERRVGKECRSRWAAEDAKKERKEETTDSDV